MSCSGSIMRYNDITSKTKKFHQHFIMVLSRFIRKVRSKCESKLLRVCLTSVRRRLNSSTRKKRTASWASGAEWCKHEKIDTLNSSNSYEFKGPGTIAWKELVVCLVSNFRPPTFLNSHAGNRPKEIPRCFRSCCMIEIISTQMRGSTERRRVCVPRIPWRHDAGLFDVHCRVWRSPHRRWAEPVGKLKKWHEF